ncbi:outer membrane protein [Aeromonas sp. RU39B]|uniref:outer membrane protein OmpW n=1 Tax=Aeromonas sp. RU39B TaxID=1907416 RepID=UPI000955657A|nr:outer membrane protein OmpW [Aeromonas sp. RU39B]SIR53704.1 outer membrane protein [Aeromonas sp. RU39B]
MTKTLPLLIAAAIASPIAMAHQAGDFLVRGGAAMVVPHESSDDVLNTGELKVNNNTQLGLTLGYMVTDNIGVELLAATPFSHTVSTRGLGEVAKVKHLPPTLMGQYYFGDAKSTVRPYVGVGVNYTTFFDEEGRGALSGTSVKVDDSWGVAGQVGVDVALNERWFMNASAWMIDIDTDVHTAVGTIKTQIDPYVFMLAAGYRF